MVDIAGEHLLGMLQAGVVKGLQPFLDLALDSSPRGSNNFMCTLRTDFLELVGVTVIIVILTVVVSQTFEVVAHRVLLGLGCSGNLGTIGDGLKRGDILGGGSISFTVADVRLCELRSLVVILGLDSKRVDMLGSFES